MALLPAALLSYLCDTSGWTKPHPHPRAPCIFSKSHWLFSRMSCPHTLENQPLGLQDKTHQICWRCRWYTDSWGQMTSYNTDSCLVWWTLVSVAKPLFLSSWTHRDDISHLPSHLGVTPLQSSRQWEVGRNDTSHLCLDHGNHLHSVPCSLPLAPTYMLRPITGTCSQRMSEPQDRCPQSPRKATSGRPHRTAM